MSRGGTASYFQFLILTQYFQKLYAAGHQIASVFGKGLGQILWVKEFYIPLYLDPAKTICNKIMQVI